MILLSRLLNQIPHLNVTIDEVVSEYNRLLEFVIQPETMEVIQDDHSRMLSIEEEIIKKIPTCSHELLDKLSDRLPHLDGVRLKRYVEDDYANDQVMTAAKCTSQAVVYLSPYDIGHQSLNDKIKNHITNLQKIGTISAKGDAFLADLAGGSQFYVVKTAKKRKFSQDLIHETFVGLYGTNNLRKKLLNFAYVYGGFKCSPPLIGSTGEVQSWCDSNKNKVNYIMYEHVSNSTSLEDFIASGKCTGIDFLNVYLQIIYALRTAEKEIGFTHYDLHTENVLIKTSDDGQPKAIEYETENGVEYFHSQYLPVIIDYGNSRIEYLNSSYGFNGLIPYFVYPDRSNIFYDLFKLLGFSAALAVEYKNREVYSVCYYLLAWFSSEPPEQIIDKHFEKYFSIPYDEGNPATVDDFINYIKQLFEIDFMSDNSDGLLPFGDDLSGSTTDEVYHQIGIDPKEKVEAPTDIYEFDRLERKLFNEGAEEDRLRIIEDFSSKVPEELKTLHQMSKQIHRELSSDVRHYEPYDFGQIGKNNFKDDDIQQNYLDNHLIADGMVDDLGTFVDNIVISQEVGELYRDDPEISKVHDYYSGLNSSISQKFASEIIPNLSAYFLNLINAGLIFDKLSDRYGDDDQLWGFSDTRKQQDEKLLGAYKALLKFSDYDF